ncbi:MAG: D-alanyl-D-alanine carboxypeptidase family protein [Eubacteriales bacterium]
MRKVASLLLALLILLSASPAYAAPASQAPDLSKAGGAILIDGSTGRILLEKDKDRKLPEASTTKIMTAILAIEKGNLSDVVTVSQNASGVEGSSIWLGVGEHVTLENLLYGLMLSSGNDAAVAIAEHISGSVDNFVADMNAKAKQIGAQNTNFLNPNGLYKKDHYTTAFDLALITAYAMKNETFRKIVSTETWRMPWEGHEYDRVLKNKNRNLWQYEGATGVKTGYTIDAGRCFVASAQKNGMELITVLLDDYDMFEDSRTLLDYGFTNYQKVNIVNKGDILGSTDVGNGIVRTVDAVADADYSYPCTGEESASIRKELKLNQMIAAPIKKGEEIGKLELYLGDQKMCEIPAVASCEILENTYGYNLMRIIKNNLFG